MCKKRIASLLAVFMLAGALFGCSTTKKKDDQGTNNQNANEPRAKIVYVFAGQGRQDDPDNAKIKKIIDDKFNIDLQIVVPPQGNYDEKLQLMLTSGEQIDYFNTGGYTAWRNYKIKGDIAMPLNELLDKYGKNLKAQVTPDRWKAVTYTDGKIYGLPQAGFTTKYVMLARKDWMTKLGISNPKTLDEFEAMLKKMAEADLDKNGKADTYPILSWGYTDLIQLMAKSFLPNGFTWWEDTDGKLKPEFMHPKYKDMLTTLQKWYKNKWIHPEEYTLKGAQRDELMAKGVSGVLPGWFTRINLIGNVKAVDPAAELTWIEPPVGPSGSSGSPEQSNVVETRVMHKNTKNGAKIMQLWDWTISKEAKALQVLGIEGEHYKWVDKEKQVFEYPTGVTAATNKYAKDSGQGFYTWIGADDATFFNGVGNPVSTLRDFLIAGKYPAYRAADYMFPYDWTNTKSKDVMNDLNTFQNEALISVITGQKPVSYWDDMIKQWLQNGGNTYIEEKTKQYKEFKGK